MTTEASFVPANSEIHSPCPCCCRRKVKGGNVCLIMNSSSFGSFGSMLFKSPSSFRQTLKQQCLKFMGWCLSCFGFFPDTKNDNEKKFYYYDVSKACSEPIATEESVFLVDSTFTHKSYDQFFTCTSLPVSSRKTPVKETRLVVRSQDANGNKMVNEYVREGKIGSGSYGKVVLHRNVNDGKLYALKVFHKKRLSKVRVSPAETALTDVFREVSIMKRLDHPNIVNLIEVIDDPSYDKSYMVLEYVEGRGILQGHGHAKGLQEEAARKYFCDVVVGLKYLHSCNIVHGDIKPENLLISSDGVVKICDFSSSKLFEGNNDELRRSPGTPVFTAPECCLGLTYHGKLADVWALGVTLYCMMLGTYPFVGETLQATYEKIVHDPLYLPAILDQDLADLLEGLLCKDPKKRITLDAAAQHPWVLKGLSNPSDVKNHGHVFFYMHDLS